MNTPMDDPSNWPVHSIGRDPLEDSDAGVIALAWAASMLNPKEIPCLSVEAAPDTSTDALLKPTIQSPTASNTEPREEA